MNVRGEEEWVGERTCALTRNITFLFVWVGPNVLYTYTPHDPDPFTVSALRLLFVWFCCIPRMADQHDSSTVPTTPVATPLRRLIPPTTPTPLSARQVQFSTLSPPPASMPRALSTSTVPLLTGPLSFHNPVCLAFSGGGIRAASFASGVLACALDEGLDIDTLACVSGGGFVGSLSCLSLSLT